MASMTRGSRSHLLVLVSLTEQRQCDQKIGLYLDVHGVIDGHDGVDVPGLDALSQPATPSLKHLQHTWEQNKAKLVKQNG